MFRVTRIAVAGVLALAIAVLPVVLDRCAESCEAHQSAVASPPACHHAASAGTHITQVPAPCDHDHHATVVTAAKSAAPAGPAFDSLKALDTAPSVVPLVAFGLRVRPHSPPDSSRTLDRRSLPLRV